MVLSISIYIIVLIIIGLIFFFFSSNKEIQETNILDDITFEKDKNLIEDNEIVPVVDNKISKLEKSNLEKIITENEKIVIIKNVKKEELLKTLGEFTEMYNEISKTITSRVIDSSTDEFIIFFPYDTSTGVLHYLVDYLGELTINGNLLGWHKIKQEDKWLIESGIDDEFAMIYQSEKTQFAGVHLTTNKNNCFELDFSVANETIIFKKTKINYINPIYSFEELIENQSYIEI